MSNFLIKWKCWCNQIISHIFWSKTKHLKWVLRECRLSAHGRHSGQKTVSRGISLSDLGQQCLKSTKGVRIEEVKTETGKQYFATFEESAGLIISNRRVQASGSESWDASSAEFQWVHSSAIRGWWIVAGRWNFEGGIFYWRAPSRELCCKYQIFPALGSMWLPASI